MNIAKVKRDIFAMPLISPAFPPGPYRFAGGRDLWSFPKLRAAPLLMVDKDTLLGTLDYGRVRVATPTMGYKYRMLNPASVRASIAAAPVASRSPLAMLAKAAKSSSPSRRRPVAHVVAAEMACAVDARGEGRGHGEHRRV